MVTIVLVNYFNKNDFDYKILPVIFIMMMQAIDCHGPKFNYDKVLATLLIISIIVMIFSLIWMVIKILMILLTIMKIWLWNSFYHSHVDYTE